MKTKETGKGDNKDIPAVHHDFGKQLKVLKANNQIRELQTVIRDR